MLDNSIIIENGTLGTKEIPVAFCYKKSDEPLPIVFLLHGHSSCKNNQIPNAIRYAKEGFFTILIDAPNHGERFTENYGVIDGKNNISVFFEIIENTKNDIVEILDTLESDPRVDISRVGMTGFSMGGYTSFYTALCDKRIKVIAPTCGTPDWTKINISYDINNLPSETKEYISKNNPILSYMEFTKIPVLVQNGAADLDVPPQGSRKFAELITPLSDKFVYVEYEGYGHEVAPEMIPNTIEWFHKYL